MLTWKKFSEKIISIGSFFICYIILATYLVVSETPQKKDSDTVSIYVAIIHEKVFLGSDDTFYIDFLQGIHLCKNFCNPTMAF